MSQFYQPIEERVVLRPEYDEVVVSLYVPITTKEYYLAITIRLPFDGQFSGLLRAKSWLIENKLEPLPTTTIDLLLDDSRTVPSVIADYSGGDLRAPPRDDLFPRTASGYFQSLGGNDSDDTNGEGLWFKDHYNPPERPKIYPANYIECMIGETRTTLVRNQPIKLLKEGYLNILQCSAGRIHTEDEMALRNLDIQTTKLSLFSERDQDWDRKQANSAVLFGVVKRSSLSHLTPVLDGEYEILSLDKSTDPSIESDGHHVWRTN